MLEVRRIAVVTKRMDTKTDTKIEPLNFEKSLSGRFQGVLRWPDLDKLWVQVKGSNLPWYIYEVGKDVPDGPILADVFEGEIDAIDKFLRDNHDQDYCGIVYADDPKAPTLIKVFGPKNLGASCGSSGSKTWPRWILSHMLPTAVGVQLDNKGKPAWWKLFSFKR